MTTYRIYTQWRKETCNVLRAFVANQFSDGFTEYKAIGMWKDTMEDALIFEIVSDCDIGIIDMLAERIKDYNSQDCVMVTATQCHMKLV